MLREFIIEPAYEIWHFQVLPGIQALWNSTLFWKLIVLALAAFFLLKILQKKKAN